MKNLIFIIFLIGFTVHINGCGDLNKTPEQLTSENNQRTANEIINKIIYIKDPRTNICFAYLWDGAAHGGPALTMVPENFIPSNMILVAEIKKQ